MIIKDADNLNDIFDFHLKFESPYFFHVDFETWKESFANDIDGEGRTLFKDLAVKAIYDNTELAGFVQYGKTAFGFDSKGEISDKISYPVIRNLYFTENRPDVGELLLNEAIKNLKTDEKIYAFFHYFGMSCFARHGKLFEKHNHIGLILQKSGFEIEHENVYYSSALNDENSIFVTIDANNLSKGNHQFLGFKIDDNQVGGCEIHYIDNSTAYLRWIYINEDMVGNGIGTKCMSTLRHFLYEKGIKRFDTDTALNNTVAQRYYEKNKFTREGITRSYYKEQKI